MKIEWLKITLPKPQNWFIINQGNPMTVMTAVTTHPFGGSNKSGQPT